MKKRPGLDSNQNEIALTSPSNLLNLSQNKFSSFTIYLSQSLGDGLSRKKLNSDEKMLTPEKRHNKNTSEMYKSTEICSQTQTIAVMK